MCFANQLLAAFEYITLKRFTPDLVFACDNSLRKLKSVAVKCLRAIVTWLEKFLLLGNDLFYKER